MVETSNKALAKYQLAINNDRFSSPTAVEESVELKLGPPQVVHEAKSTELGKPKDLTDICIEKESLLKLIESNQVAIITSEANSVVIPQIIMDDCAVKKTPCKILCVKQNRLAAIAAAQQAAEERGEKLGNSVGYQVKFRCVYAQQTVLIYCTNGIVLRSLGNDKDNFLCNVTHLIVDDVQARNKYTDLLLLFLKHNLLAFAHLKVILMSTSTDVGMFVSYFDEAPVLHVPNRSYEVQKLFLDDILTILLEVGLGMENPHVYVEKCFLNNEAINYDLIVKIIIYIHTRNKCGAILVFLPGYEEMVRCETMIESSTLNQGELQIYKVHGNMENITSSMHEKFKSQRKIILASSIAESSLLIPDVVYVIDTGKVRKEYYNYVTGSCTVGDNWISKASVHQRSSRAGVFQPGISFHLFTWARFIDMRRRDIPEIIYTPLHEICLYTKVLAPQGTKIYDNLNQALNTPSERFVEACVRSLKAIGALNKDESITPLGRYFLHFSIEPRLAKMLLYAVIFKCLDPVLTLVASLSYKSPFIEPEDTDLEELAIKKFRDLTDGHFSDHLVYIRAYQIFQEEKCSTIKSNILSNYFINGASMEVVHKIRCQLLCQLRGTNVLNQYGSLKTVNFNSKFWPIVKATLAAVSYPNVAVPSASYFTTRTDDYVVLDNYSSLNDLRTKTDLCVIYEGLSQSWHKKIISFGTIVTPFTVSLLCGKEAIVDNSMVIDNWLQFCRYYPNFPSFRQVVNNVINFKLDNVQYRFNNNEKKLLNMVGRTICLSDEFYELRAPKGVGLVPLNNANVNDRTFSIRTLFSNKTLSIENTAEDAPAIVEELNAVSLENVTEPNSSRTSSTSSDSLTFPTNTKFFLIKPFNKDALQLGLRHHTWRFLPQTEKKIFKAFYEGNVVILFFSILNSGGFQAVANLVGTNCGDVTQYCPINWLIVTNIPFNSITTRYFIDDLKACCTKHGEELNCDFGLFLYNLFMEKSNNSSI